MRPWIFSSLLNNWQAVEIACSSAECPAARQRMLARFGAAIITTAGYIDPSEHTKGQLVAIL